MKSISPEERGELNRPVGQETPGVISVLESGEPIALAGPGQDQESLKVSSPSDLDLTISFSDLPKIWQEHILKRKAEGKLSLDKNSFTRFEILQASSAADSFTESTVVDKLFDRIKKEKIDWVDLPVEWQKVLAKGKAPVNTFFDNVTVEFLLQRGARPEDIDKIRKQVAKKKQKLAETLEREKVREAIDNYFPPESITTNSDSITPEIDKPQSFNLPEKTPRWGQRFWHGAKKLFGLSK